jgi:hypothetical protein
MEDSLQHRIRERAYQLWDAGGRAEGQAEQHWLAAEREVLAQAAAVIASGKAYGRRRQRAKLASAFKNAKAS